MALLALGTALPACSVTVPLSVRSTGPGIATGNGIAIDPASGEDGTRPRFGNALASALAERGLAGGPNARLVADYAMTIGPAQGGVLNGSGSGAASTDWLAEPREARRFDKCDAQRLRGTLIVLDRATGETLYRGEGTAIECEFGSADIDALASRLVDDLLTR